MTAGAYFAGEELMIAIVRALVRAQPHAAPEPTEKVLADLAVRFGFAIQGILMAVRREGSASVTAGATLGVCVGNPRCLRMGLTEAGAVMAASGILPPSALVHPGTSRR